MRTGPVVGAALLAVVLAGCSSTGEPGHTAAIDVVPVDQAGVTQTVEAVSASFDRVTVTTATYGRDGVDGRLELVVTPADAEVAGGATRRAAARGADIRDNAALTFVFEPIDASAGKRFALTFSYAGEEPVALYRNPHDPYADGALVDAGGDLVFTLGHGDRVGGAASALARAAREASTIATGDPAFLAVWLLGLAGLAGAAVRLRRPAGDRAGSSR